MNRRILTIVVVLAVAYGLRLWLAHDSNPPAAPNMELLPRQIGSWYTVREGISPESAGVLKADSLVLRDYELTPGTRIQLFVAYYRTQHAGESMHSPRNCLPGSGWEPLSRSALSADMGRAHDAEVNRYLIEKDGNRMLIVYWYQERERIIANEFSGKLYLMWDSVRRQHRDGAIIRLSVPLRAGLTEEQALAQVRQFIRLAAPEITKALFPNTARG